MALKQEDRETVNPIDFATDKQFPEKVYSHALIILGLIAGFVVIGTFVMAYKQIPFENNDGIIAIGSAAIGGIVGIFASNNKS